MYSVTHIQHTVWLEYDPNRLIGRKSPKNSVRPTLFASNVYSYILRIAYFKRAHSGSRPTCVGCGGVVVLLWFATTVYLVYGGMLTCWHVGMLENVRFEGFLAVIIEELNFLNLDFFFPWISRKTCGHYYRGRG